MAQTVQFGKIGLPIKYNTLPAATSNLTGVIGIANNKYYKCNGTSWEEIVSPSGTLEIISNGEKDVTNYAKANVNIPNQNPYIVATPDLMPNYLTSAYEDNYVKYVGTTDENYEKNAVYQVYQYTQGNFSFRKVIWTGDADAVASNVLNGKTFYSDSTTKQTGTMVNNGQVHGIINTTTSPKYEIVEGYHDGTGYVEINAGQIVDCVAENILQGKTILGVQGTLVKGITPTGTLDITTNGIVDVTNYEKANVNVPSSGGDDVTYNIAFQKQVPTDTSKLWAYTDINYPIESLKINNVLEVAKAFEYWQIDAEYYGKCSVRVGNKWYWIGGTSRDDFTSRNDITSWVTKKMITYNLDTKEMESIDIGYYITGATAVAVGTNIYIFGGNRSTSSSSNLVWTSSSILKLDTLTNTITTIPLSLSTLQYQYFNCEVNGTDIYIAVTSSSTSTNGSLYKFNTLDNTLTNTNLAFPSIAKEVSFGTPIINNTMYVYSTNYIYIIDLDSLTIANYNITSGVYYIKFKASSCLFALKNEIYMIGGTIYRNDLAIQNDFLFKLDYKKYNDNRTDAYSDYTFKKICKIPQKLLFYFDSIICEYNNEIYLYSSADDDTNINNNYSNAQSYIYKISFKATNNQKELMVLNDSEGNEDNLFTTGKISFKPSIAQMYLSDNNGNDLNILFAKYNNAKKNWQWLNNRGKLDAPTISINENILTITPNSINSGYVSKYKINVYLDNVLKQTGFVTSPCDLSTTFSSLLANTYTIKAQSNSSFFEISDESNAVEYTVIPSVSFVQVHPQLDGEYTTLSNMDSSKIYGAHATGYGYFTYENSSWEYYNIEGTGLSVYSSTATSVTFYDTNSGNTYYNGVGPIVMIEGDTIPTTNDFVGLESDNVLAQWACFVEGTLITMADGSQKKVEDINYGDEVLCFNFNEGKQTTSYIDWMIPTQTATEYWKITLSDGTVLKLVGPKDGPNKDKSHRLYNVTKQSFMYPQDFEKDDLTLKENGDLVKVVSCEKIFETVNFYNISSKDHINVYAEGVLTSNRLNNRFEIKNNKFTDKKLMTDEEIKAYKEHMERLKK